MNQAFFEHAKEVIAKLTPADLKKAAAEHGLKLISKHAGKKLSDVPYEDLWIGMEVKGLDGDTGKIFKKEDKTENDKDNFIIIDWGRSAKTRNWQSWLTNVTVSYD